MHIQQYGRRLPVYFIIDDSDAMQGTLQVAVPEGLQMVCNQLAQHPLAVRNVYLSTLYFGETVLFRRPQPLARFSAAEMRARGKRPLQQALSQALESWRYDLIMPTATAIGDARPLVFEVLGELPDEDWHATHLALHEATDVRLPYVIALLIQAHQHRHFSALPQSRLIALRDSTGLLMERYFTWVKEVITRSCEALEAGRAHGMDFPPLPDGLIAIAHQS
jgi:uncharacterized protein YegL